MDHKMRVQSCFSSQDVEEKGNVFNQASFSCLESRVRKDFALPLAQKRAQTLS